MVTFAMSLCSMLYLPERPIGTEHLSLPVVASSSSASMQNTRIIFATGFQIPQRHYQSYAKDLASNSMLPFFVPDTSPTDGSESLDDSAEKLIGQISKLQRENTKSRTDSTILIGHSRGGAVAVVAASKAKIVVKALILIDPVDDKQGSAVHAILSNLKPIPTLILSTPFGGYSSYYRKSFASVCAPPVRGPEAFLIAFNTRNQQLGNSVNSLSYEKPEILFLEYENIGHLELLDDLKGLSFGSVCAAKGDKISTENARKNQIRAIIDFIYRNDNNK